MALTRAIYFRVRFYSLLDIKTTPSSPPPAAAAEVKANHSNEYTSNKWTFMTRNESNISPIYIRRLYSQTTPPPLLARTRNIRLDTVNIMRALCAVELIFTFPTVRYWPRKFFFFILYAIV